MKITVRKDCGVVSGKRGLQTGAVSGGVEVGGGGEVEDDEGGDGEAVGGVGVVERVETLLDGTVDDCGADSHQGRSYDDPENILESEGAAEERGVLASAPSKLLSYLVPAWSEDDKATLTASSTVNRSIGPWF